MSTSAQRLSRRRPVDPTGRLVSARISAKAPAEQVLAKPGVTQPRSTVAGLLADRLNPSVRQHGDGLRRYIQVVLKALVAAAFGYASGAAA